MRHPPAGAAVAGLVGWLVGGPVVAVFLAGAVPIVPRLVERHRTAVAQRNVGSDFATILEVAARAVRSGSPVTEALREAARMHPGDAGRQVLELVDHMGWTAHRDAAESWSRESRDRAVDIVAAVVAMVSGTTGGGARGLEAGAALLRERARTWEEVTAGASHARSSALLLLGLPVLFGAAALVVLPGAVADLFGRPLVVISVLLGMLLDAVGVWWTSRLVGGFR